MANKYKCLDRVSSPTYLSYEKISSDEELNHMNQKTDAQELEKSRFAVRKMKD